MCECEVVIWEGCVDDECWYWIKDGCWIFCSGVVMLIFDMLFNGFVKIVCDMMLCKQSDDVNCEVFVWEQVVCEQVFSLNQLKDEFIVVLLYELWYLFNLIGVKLEMLLCLLEMCDIFVVCEVVDLIW